MDLVREKGCMKRFEDLVEDYPLKLAMDSLEESVKAVKCLHDKLMILQTAISEIGMEEADQISPAQGGYSYIPIELGELFEVLFQLEKQLSVDPDYKHNDLPYRPCSFLEVGCGIGRNVYLLGATDRFCFEKVDGFDIVEEYIATGHKYFGLSESIFVDDCLTFDYGGYDIIYYYRPLQDDRMQRRFEDHLVKSCKVGAYIVGCFNIKLEKSRRLIRKDDAGRIWKRV